VRRTARSATASTAATSRAGSTRFEPPAVPGRGVARRLQAVTSLLARYRMVFSPGPSPPLDRGGAGRSSCEPARRRVLVSPLVSSAVDTRLRADARASGETRRPVRRSLTVRARRWSGRAIVLG
jgi:hypothetical protein